jgi:hypothetical protein
MDSDYYAARAVQAEEYAERAISQSLIDSYHQVADSYWALARQQTAMMHRRKMERTPEINDC